MSLLQEWRDTAYSQQTDKKQLQQFWADYFLTEKGIYEQLLENPDEEVSGTVKELAEKYQIPLILLTMGKDGSRAYYKGMRVERPGFSVKTIETTGAGDTFCGSSLNYILEHDFNSLTEDELGEMLTFANAAAAIVTTRKGAIRAMPAKEEVLEMIQD